MIHDDPERLLALAYAIPRHAAALQALFALDDTLARVLRTTREPMVGQMRLTWWHEALCRLDVAPPPAEPVLRDLHDVVLPTGVMGARLATLVEGWELLLDAGRIDDDVMLHHAAARGEALFDFTGTMVGASDQDPVAAAGSGWALADLARHLRDPEAAARALTLAGPALTAACTRRWSRPARPLGALALSARMSLSVPLDVALPLGAPRRVARLLSFRLTGR